MEHHIKAERNPCLLQIPQSTHLARVCASDAHNLVVDLSKPMDANLEVSDPSVSESATSLEVGQTERVRY